MAEAFLHATISARVRAKAAGESSLTNCVAAPGCNLVATLDFSSRVAETREPIGV